MTSRRIFLAREMTKQYETLMQGSATELLAQLATPPKGEFVGIIESGEEMTQQFQHQQVMQILLQELSPAKAARLGAQICGVNKKELYELAMSMNPQPPKIIARGRFADLCQAAIALHCRARVSWQSPVVYDGRKVRAP